MEEQMFEHASSAESVADELNDPCELSRMTCMVIMSVLDQAGGYDRYDLSSRTVYRINLGETMYTIRVVDKKNSVCVTMSEGSDKNPVHKATINHTDRDIFGSASFHLFVQSLQGIVDSHKRRRSDALYNSLTATAKGAYAFYNLFRS